MAKLSKCFYVSFASLILLGGCDIDSQKPSDTVSESTVDAHMDESSRDVIDQSLSHTDSEIITQEVETELLGEKVTFTVDYAFNRDGGDGFSMIIPLSVESTLKLNSKLDGYKLKVLSVDSKLQVVSNDMAYNGVVVGEHHTELDKVLITPDHGVLSRLEGEPVYQSSGYVSSRLNKQMVQLISSQLIKSQALLWDHVQGDSISDMMGYIKGGRAKFTWQVIAEDEQSGDTYQLLVHDELMIQN